MKINSILMLCALFCAIHLSAQGNQKTTSEILQGHWQGAFIKSNSYQKIDIQFYKSGNGLMSLQRMTEWFPQFGEFEIPVEIDSLQNISFGSGYGKIIAKLDTRNLEMIGYLDKSMPTVNIHLKKVPDPPADQYEAKAVSFKNGALEFKGHLHQPKTLPSKTAMILIGGRGCYAGATQYDLYAQSLRPYGISVLVFNKRGTGNSSGDCTKATIDDLASDIKAAKEFLQSQSNYEHIGVLGASAGSWIASRTSEMTNLDFIISIAGPATSVKDQQLQSTKYGSQFYKFSETASANALKYTNMLFDAKANNNTLREFQSMLEIAKKEGWNALLDATDIPKSKEEINSLWVRRHNYDPAKALKAFNQPYLAMFGETDWIVPFKENIELYDYYFSGDRSQLLTKVIARNAEHGTETPEEYVKLPSGETYWHFYRISPQVLIEIVDFLRSNKFID